MDPAEVIQLLNEHMTVLEPHVVYEHQGCGGQACGRLDHGGIWRAEKLRARCLRRGPVRVTRMIHERQKLNETSRHKINIGIGVATGQAPSPECMGSSDRNNYTVLGERVNLASRLCGKAGRRWRF